MTIRISQYFHSDPFNDHWLTNSTAHNIPWNPGVFAATHYLNGNDFHMYNGKLFLSQHVYNMFLIYVASLGLCFTCIHRLSKFYRQNCFEHLVAMLIFNCCIMNYKSCRYLLEGIRHLSHASRSIPLASPLTINS